MKYARPLEKEIYTLSTKLLTDLSNLLGKAYSTQYSKKADDDIEQQAQLIVDNLADWDEEATKIFLAMFPEYLKAFEQGNTLANVLFKTTEQGVLFNIVRDDALAWISEYGLDQSKLITETTKNVTKRAIIDGMVAGDSNKDIAKAITDRNVAVTPGRAKTIAETEVHNTFMRSRFTNFKYAGFKYWKWITAGDEKVRPEGKPAPGKANHVELDGKIVPIGTNFVENLRYPSDSRARAAQVINCRCDVVPATEAEYLAYIRKVR